MVLRVGHKEKSDYKKGILFLVPKIFFCKKNSQDMNCKTSSSSFNQYLIIKKTFLFLLHFKSSHRLNH